MIVIFIFFFIDIYYKLILIYILKGDEVLTQMLVVPDQVLNLPGRPTKAEVELSWLAKDIPALGFASFHVTKRYTPPPPCEEIVFRKIPITLGYKDVNIF